MSPDAAVTPADVKAVWNSLEVAKLLAAVAMPVVVVLVGLWLKPFLARIDRRAWAHQKLIEKRMGVFEDVAKPLYDVLSYFTMTNHWNAIKPTQVIEAGQKLRAAMNINRPLFSESMRKCFDQLFAACFDETSAKGGLRLKTTYVDRKSVSESAWEPGWQILFCEGSATSAAIRSAHDAFMYEFSQQMAVETGGLSGTTTK